MPRDDCYAVQVPYSMLTEQHQEIK